ncbi:MAG: transcriptional regulator, partial [Oscillospiraceae bacterium]|nr:transcriptional regulator [Oscillospiraceae bacterium]
NTVRSNQRRTKLLLILAYLLIWGCSMVVFWCLMSPSDALGFSFMFLWVLLPAANFVISLLIGWNDCWGRWKWLAAPVMGLTYMLAEYATFSTANMISNHFSPVNPPEWGMVLAGAVISLLGLGIGALIHRRRRGNRPREESAAK